MGPFVVAWFVLITVASFWLPANEGEIDAAVVLFLAPVYLVLAGLAAVGMRGSVGSAGEALISALPALALLVAAPVAGVLLNEQQEEFRGGPIFLFFGVALWASWAALVLSTAVGRRVKWSGLGGIGVTLLVAVVGLILFSAQID